MAEWTFADAWLLTAIGQFGAAGCSLSELIGAADALNHNIPLEDEARGSIGRLIASGLVEADERRLKITSEGEVLYSRRARPMFEQSPSMLRLLARVELVDGEWNLAPGEFDAAFQAYRKSFARWIGENDAAP